jgi:hypothetical protein
MLRKPPVIGTLFQRRDDEMLAPVDDSSDPTTPSEKRVRAPLRNVHEVRAELCKVYREARGQKLSVDHASKLTFILTQIAKVMETSDLQARIEKLEAKQ